MLCKKGALKNFGIFRPEGLHHICFPVNIVKFEEQYFYRPPLVTPLLNFFTESQKETIFSIKDLFMKTFKCSFNMSIRCSERTTQPETIIFSIDFPVVMIYRYFLFVYMQKM